jgi:hypothetical protein
MQTEPVLAFTKQNKSLKSRISPTRNPALILLILATVSAAGLARWCMASGVGISPDSVIYLSAADSMLAGHGLRPIAFHLTPTIAIGKPLVSFPPTYPLLLSLSGILSTDRLNGARWLHSVLFAANICLVAMIVSLATARSVWAMLCAILLFLSSSSLLELHTMAWSEPPFILFLLLALLLLMLHIRSPNYLFLVGSSLAASLALTTRYAGVTILGPMIFTVLLVGNKPLRGRVRDGLILVGIGTFPLAVWLLRNVVEADSATNRSMAIHPIGISDLNNIASSLLVFWVPFTGHAYLKTLLLFMCGSLVLAGIVSALRDRSRRERSEKMSAAAQMLAAFFVTTYLLFLVAHNSLINPAADLTGRVLSPVYVFGIILVISVMHKLSRFENRTKLWWGFLLVSFALVSVNIAHAASFALERHGNGRGYTSREWTRSESIEYVRRLSGSTAIYSNGIDVTHFLANKEALRIPAKVDPTNGKKNSEFERDMYTLRNEVIQNRAVVVYLDKITWRWYLPTKDELENIYKLPVLIRLNDGVIYGN